MRNWTHKFLFQSWCISCYRRCLRPSSSIVPFRFSTYIRFYIENPSTFPVDTTQGLELHIPCTVSSSTFVQAAHHTPTGLVYRWACLRRPLVKICGAFSGSTYQSQRACAAQVASASVCFQVAPHRSVAATATTTVWAWQWSTPGAQWRVICSSQN